MTLEEDLQKALEAKDKGNQEVVAVQERIKNGESLGNPIKDYLYVGYGTTDFPVVEQKLQELSDKVNVHNGQQVMVLYLKNKLVDEGGCFSGPEYNQEIVGRQLGVLKGELKFDLESLEIILPTEMYVQKGEEPFFFDLREGTWKGKEGGITIPGYHFESSYPFFEGERLPAPELFFGDEVELYFSTSGSSFKQYLSSRSEECFKRELLEGTFPVNAEYLTAATMLGVEVPARFKRKYDLQINYQKIKVLHAIHQGKVNSRIIKQALDLGLHQEEKTLQPEPGITINVPEYLQAQCDKYEIKIPE